MSELMNVHDTASNFRWHLLSTVSTFVLLVSISGSIDAEAAQADRPIVWLEFGGQLERVDGGEGVIAAPFTGSMPQEGFTSPLLLQRPPRYSVGGEGKISLQPKGTDWILSAAVRYGRSNGKKYLHQQTYDVRSKYYPSIGTGAKVPLSTPPPVNKLSDTTTSHRESHAILDFQVGKDVGLGIFGRNATSAFGIGIRYAQFAASATSKIGARSDLVVYNAKASPKYLPGYKFHDFYSTGSSARSFHGIGPSLSWNVSAPFAGSAETAEFTFDWGANAAVLFGRQKASIDHKTHATYHQFSRGVGADHPTYYQRSASPRRARAVTVPNVGGFAGLSLKFPDAKISLGYRADFFFGAMDGGIDTQKTYDRDFYGPFATISIGLGG